MALAHPGKASHGTTESTVHFRDPFHLPELPGGRRQRVTLHPGPSCLDAAPLTRLWTEHGLGSQEVTLDWTTPYTLFSTDRCLQDCGLCL